MRSRELYQLFSDRIHDSNLTVYNPIANLKFTTREFVLAVEDAKNLLSSTVSNKDERVGLIAGNSPFILSSLFGIWACNKSAVLISPSLRMSEALKLAQEANLKYLFICNAYHSTWTKNSSFPTIQKTGSLNFDVLSLYQFTNSKPAGPSPIGDEAVVLFSSGSTAHPKGVRLSADNLLSNINATAQIFPLGPGDDCLPLTPITHAAGLRFSLSALFSSANLHTIGIPAFPDVANMVISRDSITHASANPYIISGLLERDLGQSKYPCPRLKAITTGGGPIRKDLVRNFYSALPNTKLVHLYGLSEATSVVCGQTLTGSESVIPVGRPVDSIETTLGSDQELFLRGESLMLGYLNEPDWPKDEWFPTGDLVETDESGNLYIVGRKKNIVIRAGRNINPLEIENVLAEHPACNDCYVFGVNSEGDLGEDLVALVVPNNQILKADDFLSFLKEKLSSYKIPSELFIVEKIERSPMRKVIKELALEVYCKLKR